MAQSEHTTQSILIAPLNWGLGHASRCVPIVRKELAAGNRVTLAGDGESLTLLRQHFPELPVVHLPHLALRYSHRTTQIGAMLRALPHIVWWMIQDHSVLQQILHYQHFDKVISDNRFGFYSPHTHCIYITHQLMVKMPRGLRWAEPIARWLHGKVIRKYDECWVPDFEGENNLSGDLSHKYPLPQNTRFIGPLSRFTTILSPNATSYETVAILSGLEPQRTLLEKQLVEEYKDKMLLIIRGKINEPFCKIQRGKITIVPYLSDADLVSVLLQAETIIARSGYSTIMDCAALGILHKTHFIPTPGQTEQEYLAQYIQSHREKDILPKDYQTSTEKTGTKK